MNGRKWVCTRKGTGHKGGKKEGRKQEQALVPLALHQWEQLAVDEEGAQ